MVSRRDFGPCRAAALVTAGAALAVVLACRPAAAQQPPTASTAVDTPRADHTGLRPGTHNAVVNGVRLWYRVAGEAPADVPPVVFLHGGPGQGSAHFDALAGPHLEPALRMVYLDQRGSGHSERPWTGAYSIDLLIEDLEGVRRHLGVSQIALVGHSFGGLLALEYAARYPERVSRLVFAAGLYDTPYQCRLRLERLAEVRPDVYARVRADTLAADGTRRSDCELEFAGFESGEEREAYSTAAMYPDPAVAARIDSATRPTVSVTRASWGVRCSRGACWTTSSRGTTSSRCRCSSSRAATTVRLGQRDFVGSPTACRMPSSLSTTEAATSSI